MRPIGRRARFAAAAAAVCVLAAGAAWLAASARVQDPITLDNHVGDERCLACHQGHDGFRRTAHARTSQPATGAAIAGSFRPGENVLRTSNPYLHFRMDSTEAGFFQTAVVGTPPQADTISRRFDLVVGSGRKGQTYLHWEDGDRLYQLPVSYWTDLGRWVNSPGYRDGLADFGRPVPPRCLECHSTYFRPLPDSASISRYDTSAYLLGVGCERCHGPGREHAEREASWRAWLPGADIVNPAELSRERQVELCALCHGGVGEPVGPAFSYRPGEPLRDHLRLSVPDPGEAVDVHGNQVALLASSACFQQSTMTCSTCHDTHRPQRSAAAFSERCRGCHEVSDCGRFPREGQAIAGRCVDCHMPELTSGTVVSTFEGQRARPRVRTHWIKPYPDAVGR